MMYSLDEIGLIPARISTIKHRGDVNPFVNSPFGGEKLPVFVAPMTCILSANNICTFSQSKFEPILPVCDADLELRTQLPNGSDWLGWTAMTLDEFKHRFNACNADENLKHYVLIDVAQGHMEELFKCVKDAKQEYGNNLIVMIGNMANPETYIDCCEAGVDYVRVGIGGGAGCTTSVQTGFHASMPWLLEGIQKVTKRYKTTSIQLGTKVIADGGINTIAKAIKCLALGADYVMMGRCFAECEEALGKTFLGIFQGTTIPYRLYYGQSSEQGQIDRFGKVKSNPEGIARQVPVITNLNEFTNKFEAALRCAMSYANAHTLDEFIGKVKWEVMSPAEFKAFDK